MRACVHVCKTLYAYMNACVRVGMCVFQRGRSYMFSVSDYNLFSNRYGGNNPGIVNKSTLHAMITPFKVMAL